VLELGWGATSLSLLALSAMLYLGLVLIMGPADMTEKPLLCALGDKSGVVLARHAGRARPGRVGSW